jgi:hypothetical protein
MGSVARCQRMQHERQGSWDAGSPAAQMTEVALKLFPTRQFVSPHDMDNVTFPGARPVLGKEICWEIAGFPGTRQKR